MSRSIHPDPNPTPKLRPTSPHRLAHRTQPLRLPSYLLNHPHAIAAFHTLLVGPPVLAVGFWVGGWYTSPSAGGLGEWGVLRGAKGVGGEVRFGGMGWCRGSGDDSSGCTISPWYDVPEGYLPPSAPAFLPSLITLLNVIPAPFVLAWWIARYLPRFLTYLRTKIHNHNLPPSPPPRPLPPYNPYPWFSTLEPWLINSLLVYIILVTFTTIGLLVWIEADAGLGWSFAVVGNLGFVGWRALRGKYEGLVGEVRRERGLVRELYDRGRRDRGVV